jgi:myo-inositol 2-dehydrogenase/D-chiro-inositol 1-dehydrogenase
MKQPYFDLDKLGLGLVGCGWAARNLHMKGYGGLLEKRAVCATDESKLEKFRSDYGFEKNYKDWRTLLNDPEVDVVSICTPASNHTEIIKSAANKGKHVFVEKPLAWRPEEAIESVQACERSGVKLAVADQYRFFPQIEASAEIMRRDIIGKPFTGSCESLAFYNFPAYPGQERGFVIEQITHYIDLIRYILGDEVRQVYAKIGRSPIRGKGERREFWSTATLTFRGGCVMQLFNSWDCQGFEVPAGRPEGRLHLECERGTLFLNKDDESQVMVYSADSGKIDKLRISPVLNKEDVEAYGTGMSMRRFIECIRTGGEHPVSGREYLNTLGVAFAVYDSAEKGEMITI